MDCNDIEIYKRAFFANKFTAESRQKIVVHLVSCPKCLNNYIKYANEIGVKFNIKDEIRKINKETTNAKELIGGNLFESISFKDYALKRDLEKLSSLMCIKGLVTELNDVSMEDDTKFLWYTIEKRCENVDKLETLYKLS